MIERHINKVVEKPPYPVSDDIRRFHEQLTIIDLHADSLLWKRDLLKESKLGHIDVYRLSEGNVAIQVFGVVTRFPVGMNLGRLSLNIDLVTVLSMLHTWPRQTRNDLLQRAVYQSNKLEDIIGRSRGLMRLIRNVDDLDDFLILRKRQPGIVGALLALEGAHALNGKLANLNELYDLSFRIFGVSHFFDNDAGGSVHDRGKGGLTAFGRALIQMLQERNMIIDLSHASSRVVDEVLEMAGSSVIVSHTGVCGICNNPRNLTDDKIKKIAEAGGVIGIAMFEKAICGKSIKDVVRTIRYVSDLSGSDCIGIGSDFDGAITAPIDVSGLPRLTGELLAQGFSENQVAKIMGENALRMLRKILPRRT